MYGKIKIKVPKVLKNTTCIAGNQLMSFAITFIIAKDKVAIRIKTMPLLIILKADLVYKILLIALFEI